MAIMAYSTSTTESSGVDMSAWIAKLQEGKKSLSQLQQEMLENSLESVNNKADTEKIAKIGEEEEEEDKNTIQDPSTVTKEQLKSPIDLKV